MHSGGTSNSRFFESANAMGRGEPARGVTFLRRFLNFSSELARAYAGNPDLNQQRAGVRATDENLPRASAAWRPTATATGQYGYNYFDLTAPVSSGAAARTSGRAPTTSGSSRLRQATDPGSLGLTVTQNLFNGNRTVNGVRQAESNIFGARESLRNTEQNVLLNGATAYMDVLRDTAILDLRKNNIIVLEEQLRQTRDRFIVGEVTRTDVAQAESSLPTGRSDYFTAQANLQSSSPVLSALRLAAHHGARSDSRHHVPEVRRS
jgi:outer membrane protein